MKASNLALFSVLLGLLLASPASAQNGALGPINPGNGFPTFVQDINGVRLDMPVKPIGDGITPPTMIFDPPIAGNTWSEATGFGAEAFFFLANSTMNVGGGGRAILDLGIEAAYGGGDPRNDPPDQFLFGRVRIRIDAPALGTYVVTHPWGTQTFVVDTQTKRNISFVFDWGGFGPSPNTIPAIPSSFERLLISPTPWRFLVAAFKDPVVPNPAEWIGDGASLTTVTGGFNNFNLFRIEGPGIGVDGSNSVQTDQFMISGHIYPSGDITGALLLLGE